VLDSWPAFVVSGDVMAEQVSGKSENPRGFRWTKERDRAALLLAEDDRSDVEIAAQVGIAPSTLYAWKQHPIFEQRIAEYIAQLNAATLRYRIAKRRHRIRVLDDLHSKALDVIEHRAERYASVPDAPAEAMTGLLVEKQSETASGRVLTEWSVDTGLIRQIQSLEEQAAKELGQWAEKSEINQTATIQIIGVDVEAL
jgi:hypothetical protein